MESREEKAIRLFRTDMNCAQAIVSVFSEEMDISEDLVQRIACGFGGGMGRLQETCGAATGAFMAMGMYNSGKFPGNDERKNATYAMIQSFEQKFKALNGSLTCRDLIRCDLRTEEGRKFAKEHKLFDTICEKCVRDAVHIMEELMKS